MSVLVINLTRFGDLLQSAAALRALARKTDRNEREHGIRASNRVGVVCLSSFTDATAFLPDVTDVFPLPGATLLGALAPCPENNENASSGKHWTIALATLSAWEKELREHFANALICNITPTIASRALARLLAQQAPIAGFGIDSHGFGISSSMWASFMQATTSSRGASPFNIVDIFRRVAGDESLHADASLRPPGADVLQAMRERLHTMAPEAKGFVALQLGASEERRQWPVPFFAKVGNAAWETFGLCPVLLGSSSEKGMAAEYAAHASSPFISLAGETSLPELAAALLCTSLLVSNDTGTLHLASGLGLPVIGIFLATAQPWDTGPYAEGGYSLEPDMPCHPCSFGTPCTQAHACRSRIEPETVISLVAHVLSIPAEHPSPDNAPQALPAPCKNARIWRTTRDTHGFADLTSLSGHDAVTRTVWLRAQRQLYRQFLDRKPGQPFSPAELPPMHSLPHDDILGLSRECGIAINMLAALEEQGTLLLLRPLPAIVERFWASWQRVAAYLRESCFFPVLALLWREETQACQDISSAIALAEQYRALLLAVQASLPDNRQ